MHLAELLRACLFLNVDWKRTCIDVLLVFCVSSYIVYNSSYECICNACVKHKNCYINTIVFTRCNNPRCAFTCLLKSVFRVILINGRGNRLHDFCAVLFNVWRIDMENELVMHYSWCIFTCVRLPSGAQTEHTLIRDSVRSRSEAVLLVLWTHPVSGVDVNALIRSAADDPQLPVTGGWSQTSRTSTEINTHRVRSFGQYNNRG